MIENGFEFASSLILKKGPSGVLPHSGRLFVGFLAGAFFFCFESDFCRKTRILMICHQNDLKMISKPRIIARNGILDPIEFSDSGLVKVDLGFGDDFFEQNPSWDDFGMIISGI